jgi:hypothetical protein
MLILSLPEVDLFNTMLFLLDLLAASNTARILQTNFNTMLFLLDLLAASNKARILQTNRTLLPPISYAMYPHILYLPHK